MAGSGMLAQMRKLDTITNNLANVNSTGYKKDNMTVEALYPHSRSQQPQYKIQLVSVKRKIENKENKANTLSLQTFTNYSNGNLKRTDNPLDVALDGNGFLVVSTPNGNRYTRNGSLSQNAQGTLVTQDGFSVLGQNGPIKVGGGEVKIEHSGEVFVDGQSIDTLQVVDFPHPYPLRKTGKGLFALTNVNAQINQAPNTKVRQGFIESSNVDIINQMAKMIQTMRAYETDQKMVQSLNEAIQRTNSELGKA